jgi:hypothetical protein
MADIIPLESHILFILCMALKSAGEYDGRTIDAVRESTVPLMAWLKDNAAVKKSDPAAANGTLEVHAALDGSPGYAQVRVYPAFEASGNGFAPVCDGRIEFKRSQTDAHGIVRMQLPSGCPLMAEVTAGPHVSSFTAAFELAPGGTYVADANLRTLMNLRARGIRSGEMHHHSIYSSLVYGGTDHVVDTAADVYGSMRAAGLDFGALSDHHNTLNHKEWLAFGSDAFTPIRSKEISTSNGHVSQHGAAEDVIYRIPTDGERTDEYLRSEWLRVTGRIRELGGLPVINHPCSWQSAISFPERFSDMLPMFEGMEIWNASTPYLEGYPNTRALALWYDSLNRGVYLPSVCGSDTHNIMTNDYQAVFGKLQAIKDAVDAGYASMPEDAKHVYDWIEQAREAALRLNENWAEQCLGTAAARNLVLAGAAANEDGILDAIRNGRNVLTNGPLLFPSVNGAQPGGTAVVDGLAHIEVELYAKKPLRKLTLTGRNGTRTFPLVKRGERDGLADYSITLDGIDATGTEYLVAAVDGGITNMAIANPIFIKSHRNF